MSRHDKVLFAIANNPVSDKQLPWPLAVLLGELGIQVEAFELCRLRQVFNFVGRALMRLLAPPAGDTLVGAWMLRPRPAEFVKSIPGCNIRYCRRRPWLRTPGR